MKKILAAALITVASSMSGMASATPVALTGSMGTLGMADATYTATFSGKSFLPENYRINSLQFSFSFADDANDAWTLSAPVVNSRTSTSYAYEGGSFPWNHSRDTAVRQTVTRTGVQESAELSLAGILVGSGATARTTSSASSIDNNRVLDSVSCSYIFFCNAYYSDISTTTITNTTDWTGSFTISGLVNNQQILNTLLRDDQLLVGLKVNGDLRLTSASLVLDYTKVPEPSSMLLALVGFAGLGVARRRGARKQG